jgi:two-component system nitrogen regulation sensor histidine kinase NtrY
VKLSLRTRLTLAFALFAALPVTAALWPVSRALSEALEAEYRARLDQAARAVEGEYRRVAGAAAAAAREVAQSPEVDALSRDRGLAGVDPADTAARAAPWMRARGLDVLVVADAGNVVLTSGHLPGRAGDVDPDLLALVKSTPPGVAVPREIARATPDGVEPALVAVAWAPVAGAEPPLRVAAGFALGARFAERLAALTGGDVVVRAGGGGAPPVTAAGPRSRAGAHELAQRLFGFTRSRTRWVPIPSAAATDPSASTRGRAPHPHRAGLERGAGTRSAPTGAPAPTPRESGARRGYPERADGYPATIEITLPATGLARAQATVALALLAALAVAVLAATLAGHAVARRVTRPVEALRAGALRVAGGELATRVDVPARGELRELVDAFNAMTADLARTTERAAAAERVAAWREVARRLAHEVRNPLTPVAMSVETLRDAWSRRHPAFEEIFQEGTRAISEEVRRLARIVDEFGRFARLPAPEPVPVATEELLASVLSLYPERQGEVAVEREIEPGLPPVRADRDQIVQVLHNLVKNALDAVGARGRVRVRASRDGDEIALSISDDGPGIRPEDMERIFEPYFTTKGGGGTGLGLAIAQRIVREHGGRIDVDSPPGAGATFTVRLPVCATSPGSP